jgi:hypothetical protein
VLSILSLYLKKKFSLSLSKKNTQIGTHQATGRPPRLTGAVPQARASAALA